MERVMSDIVVHVDETGKVEGADTNIEPVRTSTPEQVFRYSDHIHKDRHIFLGQTYLSMLDMDDYDQGEFGGFGFNPVRLPSLSKVSLSLDVFHTPPQRRFNENINTYVDTRKRIKYFHYFDDFDRYASPTPDIDKIRTLGSGFLQTSAIRKPEVSAEDSTKLPPLKKNRGGLDETSFPFKLHKERTFNVVSAMPTRFTIKPVSLWRQKTDTLLYGKKLNMQRRSKVRVK